jgi:phospholipid/cholesterol/gamma-HCH transport system substrate-binding protein
VVDKSQGQYYAHFGMILQQDGPVCHRGYESTDRRPPQDGSNRPMNERARCTEPAAASNARGAQNSPRVAPFSQAGQAGVDAPVIGTFDRASGTFTYDDGSTPQVAYTGGSAAQYGDQSWMQMLLQPVLP